MNEGIIMRKLEKYKDHTYDLEKKEVMIIEYKGIEMQIWEYSKDEAVLEGAGFVIDMFADGQAEPFKSVITSTEEAK